MSSQHHTHVTCWWHVQSNLQYQILIPVRGEGGLLFLGDLLLCWGEGPPAYLICLSSRSCFP